MMSPDLLKCQRPMNIRYLTMNTCIGNIFPPNPK